MENKYLVTLIVGLLAVTVVATQFNQIIKSDYSNIEKFSSKQELKEFLEKQASQQYYGYDKSEFQVSTAQAGAENRGDTSAQATPSLDYSTTNIQVEGVDEPDIIKTDGKYIYAASAGSNFVTIINAYPAENAEIISIINTNGSVQNIFINDDKLIIFEQENYFCYDCPVIQEDAEKSSILPPEYYSQKSFIKIYNIKDRQVPELEEEIKFDGYHYDARMINNYVYAITNQQIYAYKDDIILPAIEENGEREEIAPSEISYFPVPDYNYQLTTIFAINLDNNNFERETFMTGYTQNIFVSQENIYLTSTKYIPYETSQQTILEKTYNDININAEIKNEINSIIENNDISVYEKEQRIQEIISDYYNSLDSDNKEAFLEEISEKRKEAEAEIAKESQKTIIHKIEINRDNVEYKAKGEVPGIVLNQFSMDEYENNLRIATTTGDTWSETSLNHIYILNDNLEIIGKLENLAREERIYSSRFIADRAYLVTFRQVDPLFVIDLSNERNPKVLGELKIPGYSTYLHPYDENHIIGIGQDTDEESNIAIPAGVKLALFDITDVSSPKEISKYTIGDRNTYSTALYDHKAFLFDKEKELLVIPISSYGTANNNYFEGAYVFKINLDDGFQLKGKISHSPDITTENKEGYYPYNYQILRSLYIENTLYTLSQTYLKANDLDNLEEQASIKLPEPQQQFQITLYD